MLSLQVRNSVRSLIPPSVRRELVRQLRRAMTAAGVERTMVSLTLSDNDELHDLNRTYADEDHPTDVLSFAQRDAEPAYHPPRSPDLPAEAFALPETLGDIVISVEIAQKQANEQRHDLLHELVHLSVHGLCHLLGMDHRDATEERWMFGYEALLRAQATPKGRIVPQPMPERPVLAQQKEHSA